MSAASEICERRYTSADLNRLRESRRERLELIDGEVIVAPSPATAHQVVFRRLFLAFGAALAATEAEGLFSAPYDVVLSDEDVVQPDILVVPPERTGIVGKDGIHGAPGLVVEIISPTSRRTDAVRKRALYARSGVPEYWLVDPEACVVAIYHQPEGDDYRAAALLNRTDLAKSPTIPEIEVDLEAVFAGIEEP